MTNLVEVWLFNGENSKFSSGVFENKDSAEQWIKKNRLTGVLTKYPLGISVYDWAIKNGHFKVKSEKDASSELIGKFSSAAQEHSHYENGSAD